MAQKVNELNDVRKLATIAKILDIKPIEGADNIERIFVRGWQCVAKRGEYSIGDLCIYVEVDSILPDGLSEEKRDEWCALNKQMNKASEEERDQLRSQAAAISALNTRPEFEFFRGVKFHIKTRRILGEISQGICFPLSVLESVGSFQSILGDPRGETLLLLSGFNGKAIPIIENEDFTEVLGITQYIAPDPAIMGGDANGMLQNIGILVSDEERLENLSSKYEEFKKFKYYKLEKMEGTSFTAYLKDGKFGVCGRTIDFKVPDDGLPYDQMNAYWKTAIKLDLENKMRNMQRMYNLGNFSLQGEMVGEGIQKNIYKIKGQTVLFYNAFDIDLREYWHYEAFLNALRRFELQSVPILDENFTLPENAKELLEEADITTTVFGNNPKQLIEGFVFVAKGEIPTTIRIVRASFKRISFKAKSRTYDISK